jgi:hypothetical protein
MTFGKVYYVDANHPAANDANAGTEDKPLRHIQAALDRVQPGQTVLIRGGTYRESLRWKTPGRADHAGCRTGREGGGQRLRRR